MEKKKEEKINTDSLQTNNTKINKSVSSNWLIPSAGFANYPRSSILFNYIADWRLSIYFINVVSN